MAKYTITYKCGCEVEMQLFGKQEDRYSKIEYYKTIECPHCRAKRAAEEAANAGMVALKGSEKQIAWASDIRAKAAVVAKRLLDMAQPGKRAEAEAIINRVLNQESAAWWIDNRASFGSEKDLAILAWNLK